MSTIRRLFNIKVVISILLVGLLCGFGTFSYLSDKAATQISTLRHRNLDLQKKINHLRYINDLAVEFSMDPFIVTLVDKYARQYVDKGGSEWRLLRTPEFTTYIILSLIYAESKGDPNAVGDHGRARGLTQIWVSTAKAYGDVTARQLMDPETNISFAFKHFHYLLKKYRGNLALALYAWNRGHGKVDRLIEYGKSPVNGFGKKVYEAALLNNEGLLDPNK